MNPIDRQIASEALRLKEEDKQKFFEDLIFDHKLEYGPLAKPEDFSEWIEPLMEEIREILQPSEEDLKFWMKVSSDAQEKRKERLEEILER